MRTFNIFNKESPKKALLAKRLHAVITANEGPTKYELAFCLVQVTVIINKFLLSTQVITERLQFGLQPMMTISGCTK